jgi:hypothetical protein
MTPECNLKEQITCHRYKAVKKTPADWETSIHAERIGTGANYRMYSSVWNGNAVESKL